MKRLITILMLLLSVNAIGQITTATYTNKGTTTPYINSSLYKLNGATLYLDTTNTTVRGFFTPFQYNYLHSRQATLTSGSNIKTINTLSLLGSGNLSIISSQWSTVASNNIYFDGNDSPGGKVGIGVASPSYILDVKGGMNVDSIRFNGTGEWGKTWGGGGVSDHGSLTQLDYASAGHTGFQAALTNPVTGTGTTNKIPIFTGTTALGNSGITYSSLSYDFFNTGNDNVIVARNTPNKIMIGVDATTSYIASLTNATGELPLDFFIGTGGVARFNTFGFLGVGNLNPAYRLDVTGDINIRTGSNYLYNGVSLSPKLFYQKDIDTLNNSLSGLAKVTSGVISAITDNSSNWNTSYGWGNHAGLYKTVSDSVNLHGFFTNYKALSYKQKNDSTNMSGFATNYKLTLYHSKAQLFAETNTTSKSVMLGHDAGSNENESTTRYNTFIGYTAGNNITTGNNNIFIGFAAGTSSQTGVRNTTVGNVSGFNITTGEGNAFYGYESGKESKTSSFNAFYGYGTARADTSGTGNTYLGSYSGDNTTKGNYNTAVGFASGMSNAAGNNNIYIGNRAGQYNTKSNRLYIGSLDTGSEANDSTKTLIYGVNNATTANQNLIVNADFTYDLRHCFLDVEANYTPAVTQNVYKKITPTFTAVENKFLTVAGDTITVLYSGDYLLKYNVTVTGGNGDDFTFQIRKNNVKVKANRQSTTGSSNFNTITLLWYFENLVAGDDISLWVTNTASNGDPTLSYQTVYLRKEH